MTETEAYKIVLDDLRKIEIFNGIYDAKNGCKEYMFGICAVMENIAYFARDEDFGSKFLANMVESQKENNE